jgi:O-antigen/teichoic acid export membrane protein
VELPLLAVLVPSLGATGAAIAFTCGSWVAAVSLAVAYERRQGQLLPATPRLIRYAVAVGATAPLLLAASGRAWLQGIPLIVAALAAYAVVIRLLDLVQAGEIRRLLEQAFRLALPVRRTS